MFKHLGTLIITSFISITFLTGCFSDEASKSTQAANSSQYDLSKSKGIDQDIIVSLTPKPAEQNVDVTTKIEVVFSIPLDPSSVQKNNIKLTHLSSQTNDHVKGVISYDVETKTVTYTPDEELKPGIYEVEIKSLKPTKEYKEVHIKEIKYRFSVLGITLDSIAIFPEKIELQEGGTVQLEAVGTYSDGSEKNITTEAEWQVDSQIATVDDNVTLTAVKDGVTSLSAIKDGIEASIEVIVYSVIHGHRLPPEPDPTVNNATLLGIDSNDNGVRDDVERWIYKRYNQYYPCDHGIKKVVLDGDEMLLLTGKEIKQRISITCSETPIAYHQIVREIAMQGAKADQIIVQKPESALETMKYMHAAVECNSYFEFFAKHQNEPILIDHSIFNDEYKAIQFNTAKRVRALVDYNMALSGGVYGSSPIDKLQEQCDFNVTKLLED